jgi:hypothetical protein
MAANGKCKVCKVPCTYRNSDANCWGTFKRPTCNNCYSMTAAEKRAAAKAQVQPTATYSPPPPPPPPERIDVPDQPGKQRTALPIREVIYTLDADWTEQMKIDLLKDLRQRSIPWKWESGSELVIHKKYETKVDLLIKKYDEESERSDATDRASSSMPAPPSKATELKDLHELFESGAINESEYQSLKSQIIERP